MHLKKHIRLLLITFLCSVATLGYAQVKFSFKGTLNKDSKATSLILENGDTSITIPINAERTFSFAGSVPHADEFFIKTDNSYAWSTWITTGDIIAELEEWQTDTSVAVKKKFLRINALSGPAETEKLHWFRMMQKQALKKYYAANPHTYLDSVGNYLAPYAKEYIVAHPKDKFSLLVLDFVSDKKIQAEYLKLIDASLTSGASESISRSIRRDSLTLPGTTVTDFKMKTAAKKPFSLYSLSSKYILLDFWASWCAPCRAQHPAMLQTYHAFKPLGFEIVAVSLDESRADWIKAIAADKLPWIHVSELNGRKNFLSERFQVDGIPFNMLLDENKKIIARNLAPSELSALLSTLLKK